MYSDNLIGYKYSSHIIRTHCKVFPIVLIYFYTRNAFLLRSWSSRQFNFSQCTSYIKGNKFGKTADEINDHLIRSIVEIKSFISNNWIRLSTRNAITTNKARSYLYFTICCANSNFFRTKLDVSYHKCY
jgi:hypothetical protein